MKTIGMCAVSAIGLEPARDLEAVDARHHRVEQHDSRDGLRGALQRLLAAGGDEHGVAGLVECVVQHREVVGHVVDDQHEVAIARVAAQAADQRHRGRFGLSLRPHRRGQRAAHCFELELSRQGALGGGPCHAFGLGRVDGIELIHDSAEIAEAHSLIRVRARAPPKESPAETARALTEAPGHCRSTAIQDAVPASRAVRCGAPA
jgi:hypothetical protein